LIKNNTHKSVIVEKVFNFEKIFCAIYEIQSEGPIWKPKPDYFSSMTYWRRVYKAGNSYAVFNKLKSLKNETPLVATP
jgi:hypothetical protein